MKPRKPKEDKKNGQRKNPRIHVYKGQGPGAATLAELRKVRIHHPTPRRSQ
jgi:hypothetical protein